MDVSVVIPTHCRPTLLERALASVATQTLSPSRVFVVEDGGATPETKEVIDRFAGRIGISHLESRGGACAARNVGLSATTSELVSFLDDDDWWHGEFLQRSLASLQTTGPGHHSVVSCIYIRLNEEILEIPELPSNGFLDGLTRNVGFKGTNGVFFTRSVREVGGWDVKLTALQDRDLHVRLIRHGDRPVEVIDTVAYKDQSHGMGQISYSDKRADGAWTFFVKWRRTAPVKTQARMLRIALLEQRYSSNCMRFTIGNGLWQLFYRFPERVKTKVRLLVGK